MLLLVPCILSVFFMHLRQGDSVFISRSPKLDSKNAPTQRVMRQLQKDLRSEFDLLLSNGSWNLVFQHSNLSICRLIGRSGAFDGDIPLVLTVLKVPLRLAELKRLWDWENFASTLKTMYNLDLIEDIEEEEGRLLRITTSSQGLFSLSAPREFHVSLSYSKQQGKGFMCSCSKMKVGIPRGSVVITLADIDLGGNKKAGSIRGFHQSMFWLIKGHSDQESYVVNIRREDRGGSIPSFVTYLDQVLGSVKAFRKLSAN